MGTNSSKEESDESEYQYEERPRRNRNRRRQNQQRQLQEHGQNIKVVSDGYEYTFDFVDYGERERRNQNRGQNQQRQRHNAPTNSKQTQQRHNVPTNSKQTQPRHNVPTNSKQTQPRHNVPTNSKQTQEKRNVPNNSNHQYTQQTQQWHNVPTNSNHQYTQQTQQWHNVPTNSNHQYTQQTQQWHNVPTISNHQYTQQTQQWHNVPLPTYSNYTQQTKSTNISVDPPRNLEGMYSYTGDQLHKEEKGGINETKVTYDPDEAGGQPPQYKDLFKQSHQQPQTEKLTTPNNKSGEAMPAKPAEGSLGDRGPRNVNALNDLIRKEFGSVGGSTQLLKVDMTDKLFSGRSRLYIGNLPSEVNREDAIELMSPFGELVIDSYDNEKHFGFVRLKHREQAENAQRALDGFVFKGRTLRVRFANRNACFKVHNLSPLVTNELLKKAFSSFGEVERAEIMVDNGKPTGDGYLEFADKRAGEMAFTACVESCLVLTKSLRPVILEEADPDNAQRGYGERQLQKNNDEYITEREVGPRFLTEGSPEYACALLWKKLFERRRCDEEELANKYKLEEEQLLNTVETLMGKVRNVKLG